LNSAKSALCADFAELAVVAREARYSSVSKLE
jgi:hypothetical protein